MDADQWDARYAATDLVWSVTPNQFVAAEVADLSPGSAVDLAAGEGRNAIWLASRGWDVVAVDYSSVGLAKGQRLAEDQQLPGSVSWVCADATTWESAPVHDLVVIAYLQLPAGGTPRLRRPATRRHPPGGRARHDQPGRGHRGSPGPLGAHDGRRRAGRPDGRGPRGGAGGAGGPHRRRRPRRGARAHRVGLPGARRAHRLTVRQEDWRPWFSGCSASLSTGLSTGPCVSLGAGPSTGWPGRAASGSSYTPASWAAWAFFSCRTRLQPSRATATPRPMKIAKAVQPALTSSGWGGSSTSRMTRGRTWPVMSAWNGMGTVSQEGVGTPA